MRLARQRGGKSEQENDPHDDDAEDGQNGGDDPADFAGIGVAAAAGIHSASVHFLEVGRAHDPGRDTKWSANQQAKNAKNKDECAAMWFHVEV